MRTFEYRTRVYFSDTDAEGIVYHARYLDWAEHARTEMIREMIPDYSQTALSEGEDGVFMVVRSINIEFRQPGLLDDMIEVHTGIVNMQRFSCTVHQRIMRGEDLLAELDIKIAFISSVTRKPHPIPGFLIDQLKTEA